MRPSAREFAEFNGLLRSVVEKDLPLPPAIALMAGVVRDRTLRDALTGVAAALKDGASLPDALSRYPDVFPSEYCALVRTGIETGRLADILRTSELHYSYRARLGSKVRRLLLYLLAGAIVGEIVLVITLSVGGYINDLNDQVIGELQITARTEFDLFIRDAVKSGWVLLLAWPLSLVLTCLAYVGLQRWATVGWIGYVLPLWGQVQKSRDLALFCTTVGLRVRSGAAVVDALRAARDSVKNYLFRRSTADLIKRVEEGEALSSALFYVTFFPKTLSWGLSLAEENGEVPRALDTFAGLYTTQMERNFEMLYEILTPVGILAVGNIALLSAMMLLSPFFYMMQITSGL